MDISAEIENLDPVDMAGIESVFVQVVLSMNLVLEARMNLFLRNHNVRLDKHKLVDRISRKHIELAQDSFQVVYDCRLLGVQLYPIMTFEEARAHYWKLLT